MSRKKLIAANWKMYKTPEEALAFTKAFIPLIANAKHAEIVLSASPTLLPTVVDAARNNPIHVAAQNMHWHDQGAYTGETSPLQLKALGVTHVLIGHSERRQYFNETDESVNLKLKAALAHGLIPIVCVGEQLAERESDQTQEVLERQTSIALEGIDPAIATPLVIAYEPVWAIGTGRTATPEMASDAHKIIRAQIAKSLSPALAASTRILYGGSVKPDNTQSLCCLEDIDGALVGGASLEPASFAQIVANSAA
ncbi:MAG TPA: triose-phosphate isomerase [Acidobacteriaceae bacterium]|nr:triose-phosphate isomerase [Acidobacteriaceae bacterium]